MGSITSANSIFMLGISGVYAVPQQLQQFDTDDIFSAESIDTAELRMGVDGIQSAGYVPMAVKMTIAFMASSPSVQLFETWYASERAAQDKFFAFGSILLPATGTVYTLNNGALFSYSPLPDAKKVLQARKFGISWESITPAPVA